VVGGGALTVALKKLNSALMLLGCGAGIECSQVSLLPRGGVRLSRVKPEFSVGKFSDHATILSLESANANPAKINQSWFQRHCILQSPPFNLHPIVCILTSVLEFVAAECARRSSDYQRSYFDLPLLGGGKRFLPNS